MDFVAPRLKTDAIGKGRLNGVIHGGQVLGRIVRIHAVIVQVQPVGNDCFKSVVLSNLGRHRV